MFHNFEFRAYIACYVLCVMRRLLAFLVNVARAQAVFVLFALPPESPLEATKDIYSQVGVGRLGP